LVAGRRYIFTQGKISIFSVGIHQKRLKNWDDREFLSDMMGNRTESLKKLFLGGVVVLLSNCDEVCGVGSGCRVE
jgi:hypothetical protein